MYEYRARIIKVHDGDTVTADIDLGFGVWMRNQSLRLAGLDAPELPTPEGVQSRDALAALVVNQDVVLRTHKDRNDKYGRMLGTLMIGETNINVYLMVHGLARPYDGGKR